MFKPIKIEEVKLAYQKLGLKPANCTFFSLDGLLTVCPVTVMYLASKHGKIPYGFPDSNPGFYIKEILYWANETYQKSYVDAFITGYDGSKSFKEMRNATKREREAYMDGKRVAEKL